MAAAVLLSSCVKDTLYDTPHPDYGKIAVTADWSARGEYTYTVSLAAAKGYTIESNGSYTVYNADGLMNVAESAARCMSAVWWVFK